MLWTTFQLKISGGTYGDTTTVKMPEETERGWRHRTVDSRLSSDFVRQILYQHNKAIILFTLEFDKKWIAETLQNGIAFEYPEDGDWEARGMESPQVHIYPLAFLPWFRDRYRSEVDSLAEDPFIFIDGKPLAWTKEICYSCPNLLERSVKKCFPVHRSCEYQLVDDKHSPPANCRWLREHAPQIDNLPQDGYKDVKSMSTAEAFEKFSICRLSTDEKALAKIKEDRSANAKTAALTRHWKKHACSQCEISTYCWAANRGASNCAGPVLQEDYDYFWQKTQPWMVHVLLLHGREMEASSITPEWDKARINAEVLAPYTGYASVTPHSDKHKEDIRKVVVMRPIMGNPWAVIPYKVACALLNEKPVTKWAQIPKEFRDSRPVRAVAYGLAARLIRRQDSVRSAYSSREIELVELSVKPNSVTLFYDNNKRSYAIRRSLGKADFYEDLRTLPGIEGGNYVMTSLRKRQSELFRVALKERLKVTMEMSHDIVAHGDGDIPVSNLLSEVEKRCRKPKRSKRKKVKSETGVAAIEL